MSETGIPANPLVRITQSKTSQKEPRTAAPNAMQAMFLGADPISDEPRWQDQAACRGRSMDMFPRFQKDISYITLARQICRSCPVQAPCLDYALQWPSTDMHGVWAGKTPRQLAAEQQKRGVKNIRPTVAQIWAEFDKLEKKQRVEDERDITD